MRKYIGFIAIALSFIFTSNLQAQSGRASGQPSGVAAYIATQTLDSVDVAAGELAIAGTKVTATAAELNQVADVSLNAFIITDDTTLTAASSGRVIMIGTDAKTVTLPATAIGLTYTFVNIGADGNNIMTISPNAADYIAGTATLAASVVDLGVVVDKDIINTKATSITGDAVTIVADGVDGWYVVSSAGIWASE